MKKIINGVEYYLPGGIVVIMDPNKLFQMFLDTRRTDSFGAYLHAVDLLYWLNIGGFEPEHQQWFRWDAKGKPLPRQWTKEQLRNWTLEYETHFDS